MPNVPSAPGIIFLDPSLVLDAFLQLVWSQSFTTLNYFVEHYQIKLPPSRERLQTKTRSLVYCQECRHITTS